MKFKLLGVLGFSILLVIFGSSVAFAQEIPEEIAKKHGISFPIAELGGCVDYSSCRTYCEDPINQSQCIDFAKKKGLYKEEDNAQSQNTRMLSAKTELGCDSEASCREFCGSQANWEKCGEFAKKHRLSGGHIENPKKAEILKQAKEELGCTSYESCMAFCHEEANAQKCSEFAKKVGLRGGQVHAGPGGCTSEETCKKVCSDPSNYEICNKFTSVEGGKFHGPGGCDSEQSCKAYCQLHPQECGHIGESIRYNSLEEMCSRTPNCSWSDNGCQCHSPGISVRGPGYESKYCQEFPGKCAIPSQHVVITPSEEYCKKFPDRCFFNKPLSGSSYVYPTFIPIPTLIPTAYTVNTPTPISIPIITISQNQITDVVTPTKAPVRVPNPPIINLSFPSENQFITFTSTAQTFCIVDTPGGGDTSGLQRKHNINNQGWNSYGDNYTLCFAPKEGDNTISLQYRNKYGDESTMYTRQFTFHLMPPTPTPSVSGCAPVTFTVIQTGTAVIKVDGAWSLSVKATPNFINADFDTANKSITLHFNAEHGTINIYKYGYEGAPLCQTYSF